MHIKTEPCPEAGTRETYHVIICEDDPDETPASILGHLTRADDGANSWTLKLHNPSEDGKDPVTFEGADIDEVRAAIEKQFTHMKVNANRLGLGVMSQFVDDLMDPVIALAEQTGSTTAMIHALVHVMSRVIATRIPESAHPALEDLIARQLKRDLSGYASTRSAQKQFADMLKRKFEEASGEASITDLFEGNDDEQTRKH
jgi:hypothetical protein